MPLVSVRSVDAGEAGWDGVIQLCSPPDVPDAAEEAGAVSLTGGMTEEDPAPEAAAVLLRSVSDGSDGAEDFGPRDDVEAADETDEDVAEDFGAAASWMPKPASTLGRSILVSSAGERSTVASSRPEVAADVVVVPLDRPAPYAPSDPEGEPAAAPGLSDLVEPGA